jgi:hypothetical protein
MLLVTAGTSTVSSGHDADDVDQELLKTAEIMINKEDQSEDGNCVAINMIDIKERRTWVRIPCETPLPRSTFLCHETTRLDSLWRTQTVPFLYKFNYCPSQWSKFEEICTRIVSVKTRLSNEDPRDICTALQARDSNVLGDV